MQHTWKEVEKEEDYTTPFTKPWDWRNHLSDGESTLSYSWDEVLSDVSTVSDDERAMSTTSEGDESSAESLHHSGGDASGWKSTSPCLHRDEQSTGSNQPHILRYSGNRWNNLPRELPSSEKLERCNEVLPKGWELLSPWTDNEEVEHSFCGCDKGCKGWQSLRCTRDSGNWWRKDMPRPAIIREDTPRIAKKLPPKATSLTGERAIELWDTVQLGQGPFVTFTRRNQPRQDNTSSIPTAELVTNTPLRPASQQRY